MKRSMQLRIRTLASSSATSRARRARRGVGSSERSAARRGGAEKAAALDAEKSGLATVYAEVLRAGLAALSGGEPAVRAFEQARAAFAAMSMPLHVAACDYRLAELAGDAKAREGAAERLSGFGVAAPEHFVDMLVPRARAA